MASVKSVIAGLSNLKKSFDQYLMQTEYVLQIFVLIKQIAKITSKQH